MGRETTWYASSRPCHSRSRCNASHPRERGLRRLQPLLRYARSALLVVLVLIEGDDEDVDRAELLHQILDYRAFDDLTDAGATGLADHELGYVVLLGVANDLVDGGPMKG